MMNLNFPLTLLARGVFAMSLGLLSPSFLPASTLDTNLTLTSPILTNGQVQLSVLGEPGVTCVIQSSPDLSSWTPILTNSDFSPTRVVTVDAPNDSSYYRAVIPSFPHFGYAVAAVTTVNLNGNGFITDSFNSSDTNLSTGGYYNASKISTNGDMATVKGMVNIGTHTIDGNLFLGPAASYISSTNQVLGSIYTNRTLSFPNVVMPPALASSPTVPIVGHSPNFTNWITVNGYYTINNAYPIVVGTNVTTWVRMTTANFNSSITLQGEITNSATAYLYFDPASATSATIVNSPSARARNLVIYGLPNLTQLTVNQSTFTGVIYAPTAIVTLSGGGGANHIMGSVIGRSITMNAHYEFHFDEDLLNLLNFP